MEEIRQKLMESIFEVFERMLFVFLELADEPGTAFDLAASIRFDSDKTNGVCRLMVGRDLACVMAQNLMGPGDEELNDQTIEDCLKEALNMVSGNFLSKYDRGRVFNLSIPELVGGSTASDMPGGDAEYKLDFDSDYGKMCMMMTMSGS